MRCFLLGHKFGKLDDKGYQYCERCGVAQKPADPHPCENGHIWEDEYSQQYQNTKRNPYYGTQVNVSIQYFQTCKICGAKRSVEV